MQGGSRLKLMSFITSRDRKLITVVLACLLILSHVIYLSTSNSRYHEGRESYLSGLRGVRYNPFTIAILSTEAISSSSSGLGLATVYDLLLQKAYVSIVDRSPAPDAILSSPNVKFYKTDITELSEVTSAVNQTVEWTSRTGAPLGGVINCAGVGTAAKIIDANGKPHSLDIWEFTIAVNLTGSFNLTRLVLEHLVKVDPETERDGERGVVIFVSSAAAVSDSVFKANNELYPLIYSHSSKVSQVKRLTQQLRALFGQ